MALEDNRKLGGASSTEAVDSGSVSGAGTGGKGEAAPCPFTRRGKGGGGGQYCPLRFSTIVTKQTFANLKARFPKAG